MNDASAPTGSVSRVADALAGVAQALADASLDGLAAAERDLSAALSALPLTPPSRLPDGQTAPGGREVARLRRNLERCRRLGAALEGVAQAFAAAHTLARGYDSRGTLPQAASGGTSWEASA